MKIQTASDLHFEFLQPHKYARLMEQFKGEADVLILAGDIVPLRFVDQVRDTLGSFCEKYRHVVYVPGNHEFYKTNPKEAMIVLGAVENELYNLHVLKNSLLMLDGQRFYGGTMWFPELPGNGAIKTLLNDFLLIKDFEPWVYDQNALFEQWFRSFVDDKTIVVSHHLPNFTSVPERFRDKVMGAPSLNRFFVNDITELMLEKSPRLWVHGHTHDGCDYQLAKTRVVCNPRGYPGEGGVNKFNSNFIIEV